MKKLNAIGAAVGTLVLGMGIAFAQAPAAPAAAAPAAAKKGSGANVGKAKAPSESAAAVEAAAAAEAMARYGDQTKDPLLLIAAAKVLKEVGGSDSTAKRTGGKPAEAKNKPDPLSADAILARAKELAGSRQDLVALVDDVAKAGARGGARGPGILRDTVVGRGRTDSYRIVFRGGEPARVHVRGDGDSDLDLFVYDEHGNLVCKDDDSTDEMLCSWTPRWTGPFTIRVRNLGAANMYTIRHN